MTDYTTVLSRIFVLLKKLFCSGKSHLIDVFLNLLLGHSYSFIDDVDFLSFFINLHFDGKVA